MNDYHRHVLLEAGYALDHLLWSYRSQLDQEPARPIDATEICLSDYASRTASLVRGVLDEDSKRSGPRLAFRPPGYSDGKRLAAAIAARREVLAAKRAAQAGTAETASHESGADPALDDPSPDADASDAREACSSVRGFRRRPR